MRIERWASISYNCVTITIVSKKFYDNISTELKSVEVTGMETQSYQVSAIRAIIIVVSMIARDVATRRAGLHAHSRI
jgi:hypothetical protein